MNTIITSFYTQNGIPAVGLTPTIRIWEVLNLTHSQVVPLVGPDPYMDEVGDGFYKFTFDSSDGFDSLKTYVARCDGGVTIVNPGERYQSVGIDATIPGGVAITPTDISNIVDGILDEPSANHLQPGSVGLHLNEVHADVQQLRVDVTTALSVVNTLIKYERNRTKIDKVAMTLTVYNDDGITPLRVFNLRDSNGAPSVTEVCERVPV